MNSCELLKHGVIEHEKGTKNELQQFYFWYEYLEMELTRSNEDYQQLDPKCGVAVSCWREGCICKFIYFDLYPALSFKNALGGRSVELSENTSKRRNYLCYGH